MTGDNALREFLASRRAAIDPQQTGLPSSPGGRRVPGLRREEVAALAGVSVAYYTKLEQGRVGRISDEVLTAVENALRLDELERLHFRTLVEDAGHRAGRARPPVAAKTRPALLTMIHALDPVPAMIYGPRLDVLAVNHTARLLIDDFEAMPVKDRNLARWTFLNPRAKILYPKWHVIAPQVAAALRHITVGRTADPQMEQLIGEISVASPEFAGYWAAYRLHEHSHGVKQFYNETVGDLTLRFETLSPRGDDGQNVVVYTADRGSPSEEKLHLLASWNAPSVRPGNQPNSAPRPSSTPDHP
jgi:transcriptional regulator with XRE-family HTH domain